MITSGSSRSAARKRGGERLGVGENLPLANVTILRVDDVFDWVLERDDVIVPLDIDLLNHSGKRG